jgi:AraC-like DNA-binding protein
MLLLKFKNLLNSRKKFREYFIREAYNFYCGFDRMRNIEPKPIEVRSIDEKFVQKLMLIIEEKIPDSEFGVNELSRMVGMGNTQLFLKMKALFDVSPGDFIKQMRLKRASQLLSQKKLTVSEITYMVGFSDPKYFSKCFKAYFGKTPTEFMGGDNS